MSASLGRLMIGRLVFSLDFLVWAIYSFGAGSGEVDKIIWIPSSKEKFSVCSYCEALATQDSNHFLWKSICRE